MANIASASQSVREFELELEAERARRLRRRFVWMCGVSITLSAVSLPFMFMTEAGEGSLRAGHLVRAWWVVFATALYVAAVVLAYRGAREPRAVNRLAMGLVLFFLVMATPVERVASHIEGASAMSVRVRASTRASERATKPPATVGVQGDGRAAAATTTAASTRAAAASTRAAAAAHEAEEMMFEALKVFDRPAVRTELVSVYGISVAHLVACLFMPWTLRESAKVGGAGLLSFAAVMGIDAAAGNLSWVGAGAGTVTLAALMSPAAAWCWWRHSRFRTEFVYHFESGRYRELREEIASARRIHESCLPRQVLSGPVRVSYAYRPMSDLGGDLVFHRAPAGGASEGAHLVALIDVTGHGVAAALSVNRLLGELERVSRENPDASPGELLAALNAYARLMLAQHGLYLSALVFRLDPVSRTVTYVSGGHPTAYLLSPGGATRELESTAPLLGAFPSEEYEPAPVTVPLGAGEVVVACTDGATESKRPDGEMLRSGGMRDLVEQVFRSGSVSVEELPGACLLRLDALRPGGPQAAEDDTLIVAMRWG